MEIVSLKNVEYDELEIKEIEDSKNFTMDFEVDDTHYYTLENGLVSHNTVSLMTQTSSGIECAFLIYYKRRRKINPQETNVKVDFVDEVGDSWQEYSVFHHRFKDYLTANGYDPEKVKDMNDDEIDKIVKKSPYYKATSNDVDWVKKVEMQGMIQKHIDHSISVTVNLPSDVNEELVSDVYKTAWEHGCKGVTIYRDGSRSGVLVSNKDSEKKTGTIEKTSAPKRHKHLYCDIHHVTAQAKKWIVIVGLLEGEPYEVFAFKTKKIHLPTSIKNGELVKIKKGYYNLECDNDFVIENVGEHFESDEQEALTRMISMGLRHGADIQYVVEQLNKSEGNITSFSKAVARSLKKYIKDGTKTSMSCESCESENVQYQEGCVICLDCGNGKCG